MADMSEETPLLQPSNGTKDLYERFSSGRKWSIVAMVSWTGFLPFIASGSFFPSIPQIAKDLESSPATVGFAISLSMFTIAISSLLWARYSGYYGRRPIYLSSMPICCIGSLGVGLAQNVPQLLFFRVVQALGASSGMSVGSAVVADIYRLEERGTAMGVFFAAVLAGPALAPLAGGFASHYFTWRHVHYVLFIASFLGFVAMVKYLPETSHPGSRGIDRIIETTSEMRPNGFAPKWKWVWLSPLHSMWLLRSPNLMAVMLAGTTVLIADYVLIIPAAYTIGVRYNITNEAIIGACFIPSGIGSMIGAPLAGRISDRTVVDWRKRRNGEWVPEDRLRTALFGAWFLVPVSVLVCGAVIQWVPGVLGISVVLVMLFLNGLGVDYVLSPSAAYNVDVMYSRSAEIMAANQGVRGIIMAFATAAMIPCVNTFGVFVTNLVAAIIAWFGFGLLVLTIKYGDKMRAWVDVGFSNVANT